MNIGIDAYAACFDRMPMHLPDIPGIVVREQTRTRKTTSPAAAYALDAVRALPAFPTHVPLVTISGPTGCTATAFEGARARSSDGRLTGTDFAENRYKRIHPLTLITSLQNQVPALVSMTLGLTGPCINALEGACALVDLLPNIEALAAAHGQVLLVAAAAGDRDEDRTKHAVMFPGVPPLEGAVCFLLSPVGALGRLAAAPPDDQAAAHAPPAPAPPVLAAPLAVLRGIAGGKPYTRTFADGDYRRTLCFHPA